MIKRMLGKQLSLVLSFENANLKLKVVPVSSNRMVPLMGLYLTGFYNTSYILAMSLVASNTSGATKKSFVSVSMAIAYGMSVILCLCRL